MFRGFFGGRLGPQTLPVACKRQDDCKTNLFLSMSAWSLDLSGVDTAGEVLADLIVCGVMGEGSPLLLLFEFSEVKLDSIAEGEL